MEPMFPKPKRRFRELPNRPRGSVPKKWRLSVDEEATAHAGFKDRRSFVHLDGRLFLFGVDMSEQCDRVYERDKGICQACGGHVARKFAEIDHIKSKGMHPRDDSMTNLQTLCGNWTFNRCHKVKTGRETRFGEGAA